MDVCVCVCVCVRYTLRVTRVWKTAIRANPFQTKLRRSRRGKNVPPTDREYGGPARAVRLHENEEKNLFRPYEKRRASGRDLCGTSARGKARRENFAFSAGSFVIV